MSWFLISKKLPHVKPDLMLSPGYKGDWSKIYSLPFKVALNTYIRQFQYKLHKRVVFTNTKLNKFGLICLPLFTFRGKESETPEHFFVSCHLSKDFSKKFLTGYNCVMFIRLLMVTSCLVNHILFAQ